MLTLLHENEKILLVMRKHWFVMLRTVILFIILLLAPSAVLTALPFFTQNADYEMLEPVVNLFLSMYIMALLVLLFLFWMDYYLDMWIITSDRVIDVEQKGLFNRTIGEIPIKHVQDVTLEVEGFIETLLKFGTIRIQTAGEREFRINDVPHLYEAKDIILRCARKANGITN